MTTSDLVDSRHGADFVCRQTAVAGAGGPPRVRYEQLLPGPEGRRPLARLLSRWRGRLFSRFETAPPGPLQRVVIAVDVSRSAPAVQVYPMSDPGVDPGARGLRSKTGGRQTESWSSLFLDLCGDGLPHSAKESPALWGSRLASSLLSPAGRIPRMDRFQERTLVRVLQDLPGWEEEPLQALLWFRASAGQCVRHWRREEAKPRPPLREIHWHAEDRCGFFLNRVLSYPEKQIEEHGNGLRQLGGLTRALGFAWSLLYRSLAALPAGWRLPIRQSRAAFLFTLAEAVARAWKAEVRADSCRFVNAFLVRSATRSVIYLHERLDHRLQAWGVCHELAHLVLGHDSNSSYGLNSRWLTPEELRSFDRQEAVADALASLWLHLFEGLTDLGLALQRPGQVRAAPGPRRLPPVRPGAVSRAGAARADPSPPPSPSP